MWSVHSRPLQKPVTMLGTLEEELRYLLGAAPGQGRTLTLPWGKQMGNLRAREGQVAPATPFVHLHF